MTTRYTITDKTSGRYWNPAGEQWVSEMHGGYKTYATQATALRAASRLIQKTGRSIDAVVDPATTR